MNWSYKIAGIELKEEDVPETAIGFIYIIRHKETRQRYLGKKLLTKAATKIVAGKRKKIRKPSDWQDYWSSSPYLVELIEKEGKDKFDRVIIDWAYSKGELNFKEESAQYQLRVLESDEWYNSNIRSRIFKKNVMKYDLKDFHKQISFLDNTRVC